MNLTNEELKMISMSDKEARKDAYDFAQEDKLNVTQAFVYSDLQRSNIVEKITQYRAHREKQFVETSDGVFAKIHDNLLIKITPELKQSHGREYKVEIKGTYGSVTDFKEYLATKGIENKKFDQPIRTPLSWEGAELPETKGHRIITYRPRNNKQVKNERSKLKNLLN